MIFTVVNINIFFHADWSDFAMIFEVVVFPFVPVTQIIVISLLGNLYIMFAIIARIL